MRWMSQCTTSLPRTLPRAAVIDLPRAMDVTRSYWFAMLAASAFGTNVGDLWAEALFPGRFASLASLLAHLRRSRLVSSPRGRTHRGRLLGCNRRNAGGCDQPC